MPIPLEVAAAVSGGLGLLQTGLGLSSRAKAKKRLREAQSFYEENKYEIPESARAALGVAERQAGTLRLPGEDIARARIGETVASGVGAAREAATSSSDVLSVLSSLYGGQISAERGLAEQAAQRYDVNQAQLRDALGRMAQFEQEEFKYNVLMPYQQMLGQAEAYGARGAQELSSGLSSLGGTLGGLVQAESARSGQQGLLDRLGIGRFGQVNPINMQQLAPIGSGQLPYTPPITNQLVGF